MELGVLITGGEQPLIVERQFRELIEDGTFEKLKYNNMYCLNLMK